VLHSSWDNDDVVERAIIVDAAPKAPRLFLVAMLIAVVHGADEFARAGVMAAPGGRGEAHAAHSAAVLAQQPHLSGTVRDERGEPIVDMEVVALRRSADRRRLEIHGRARTDDRGQYRIRLPAGTNDYLVRVHGYGDSRLRSTSAQAVLMYPVMYYPAATASSAAWPVEVEPGDERAGIDFTLHALRGVRVSGTLPNSGTLAGRSVALSLVAVQAGQPQWDLPLGSARVPPEGRFSFSNVPPGTYLLCAVAFPFHADRPTATVRDMSGTSLLGVRMTVGRRVSGPVGPPPPGDTSWIKETVIVEDADVEVPLTFSRGARLSGRLVFDGASIAPTADVLERTAVRILAADGADLGPVPLSGLEAGGQFQIVGVPPGDYEIELQWPNYAGWHLRSLTVSGRDLFGRPIAVGSTDIKDVVFTFTDRPTSIAGVLRTASGQPVEGGGTVIAFPTDRATWSGTWPWLAARTGQSVEGGRFAVQVRGAGEYYVAGVSLVPSAIRPRLTDATVLEALARSAIVVRAAEGQQLTADVTASDAP
jgi:hypothetical protein